MKCYHIAALATFFLLGAHISVAQDAPATTSAEPSTRPNSETIGVRISKLTRNPDGTILATFATKDKVGNTIPRDVLFTAETIVNYNGQMKKTSDVQDEWIKDVVVAMVAPGDKNAVMVRWGRTMLNITKEDVSSAQYAKLQAVAPRPTIQSNQAIDERVDAIVAALYLNAPEREERVKNVIRTDLRAVREAHNAWLTPSKSVQDDLNKGLAADLTPGQIDTVKNAITSNIIRRHYIAYHVIVPGLTKEEDTKIMDVLKQAREDALNSKNPRDQSRAFEPHKKQIEQYLISKGHDWPALYKKNSSKVGNVQAKAVPADTGD